MPFVGFSAWVSTLARKSGLSVDIHETETEYLADFSDGTKLVYCIGTMKIRMTPGRSASKG